MTWDFRRLGPDPSVLPFLDTEVRIRRGFPNRYPDSWVCVRDVLSTPPSIVSGEGKGHPRQSATVLTSESPEGPSHFSRDGRP